MTQRRSLIDPTPQYEFSVYDIHSQSNHKYNSKQVDLLTLLTQNIVRDLKDLKVDKLTKIQAMKNPSSSIEAASVCLHILFYEKKNVTWSDVTRLKAQDFYLRMLKFQELEIKEDQLQKAKQTYLAYLQTDQNIKDIIFASQNNQFIICKQEELKSKSAYQLIINLAGHFLSLFEILYELNRKANNVNQIEEKEDTNTEIIIIPEEQRLSTQYPVQIESRYYDQEELNSDSSDHLGSMIVSQKQTNDNDQNLRSQDLKISNQSLCDYNIDKSSPSSQYPIDTKYQQSEVKQPKTYLQTQAIEDNTNKRSKDLKASNSSFSDYQITHKQFDNLQTSIDTEIKKHQFIGITQPQIKTLQQANQNNKYNKGPNSKTSNKTPVNNQVNVQRPSMIISASQKMQKCDPSAGEQSEIQKQKLVNDNNTDSKSHELKTSQTTTGSNEYFCDVSAYPLLNMNTQTQKFQQSEGKLSGINSQRQVIQKNYTDSKPQDSINLSTTFGVTDDLCKSLAKNPQNLILKKLDKNQNPQPKQLQIVQASTKQNSIGRLIKTERSRSPNQSTKSPNQSTKSPIDRLKQMIQLQNTNKTLPQKQKFPTRYDKLYTDTAEDIMNKQIHKFSADRMIASHKTNQISKIYQQQSQKASIHKKDDHNLRVTNERPLSHRYNNTLLDTREFCKGTKNLTPRGVKICRSKSPIQERSPTPHRCENLDQITHLRQGINSINQDIEVSNKKLDQMNQEVNKLTWNMLREEKFIHKKYMSKDNKEEFIRSEQWRSLQAQVKVQKAEQDLEYKTQRRKYYGPEGPNQQEELETEKQKNIHLKQQQQKIAEERPKYINKDDQYNQLRKMYLELYQFNH